MFCPRCGKELSDNARFCYKCGTAVKKIEDTSGFSDNKGATIKYEAEPEYEEWYDDGEFQGSNIIRVLIVAGGCLAVGILCAVILVHTGALDKLLDRGDKKESASEELTEEAKYESQTANENEEMAESGEEASGQGADSMFVAGAADDDEIVAEAASEDEEAATMEDDDTIHDYEVIIDNVDWMEAFEDCKRRGGYLARINSDEEYRKIKELLADKDFRGVVYLGGMRDSDSHEYHWIDDEMEAFPTVLNSGEYDRYWLDGEPSFEDINDNYSVDEEYLSMLYVKKQDGWVWNDIPGNLFELRPDYYDGRVAYICEYK